MHRCRARPLQKRSRAWRAWRGVALAAVCGALCIIGSALIDRPSSADDASQLLLFSLFGSIHGPWQLFAAPGPAGTFYLGAMANAGNYAITPNALQPNAPVIPSPPDRSPNPFPIFLAAIDPSQQGPAQLTYSSYFGSNGPACYPRFCYLDLLWGFAVDKAGRFYVCGSTGSTTFPVTSGALQTVNPMASNPLIKRLHSAPTAAFFSVIDPSRSGSSQLVYSTYLGGQSGGSSCFGVAVDDSGRAYLTGLTTAKDFPLTRNAFQRQERGFRGDFTNSFANAFVTVIDPARTGPSSLVYSTFLGGGHQTATQDNMGDYGNAIAPGPGGLIYVAGLATTADFPVSSSAFQNHIALSTLSGDSINDFLTVLNPARSGTAGLVYSTYLGGNSDSSTAWVAADALGDAYVGGSAVFGTGAHQFPTTAGAFQRSPVGASSYTTFATLSKIDPFKRGNASLLYSTVFGGPNDVVEPNAFALDSRGFVYVVGGFTQASGYTFPITPDAFQSMLDLGANSASFLSIFDPLASGDASLLYSTFLGNDKGGPRAVFTDSAGRAYMAGTDAILPTTANSYSSTGNTFVAILNPPIPSNAPTLGPPPTPTPAPTPRLGAVPRP